MYPDNRPPGYPPPNASAAYSPPGAGRERGLFIALAVMLWGLASLALLFVVFCYLFVLVWLSAEGSADEWATTGMTGLLALVVTAAVVLTLALVPPIRRLPVPTRLTILGALACSTPTVLACYVLVQMLS